MCIIDWSSDVCSSDLALRARPDRAGAGDRLMDTAEQDVAEQARKLFAGPIEFLKSAPGLEFLPDQSVPEIAFAGRSNVGKRSLLNALHNRKGLARPERQGAVQGEKVDEGVYTG